MKFHCCTLFLVPLALLGCGGGSPTSNPRPPPPPPTTNANAPFQNVSATNLPTASLTGMCMDVDHGDVDGDGDMDLALAQEHATNIILLNNGAGVFSVAVGAVNGGTGDNEDVRLRDFGGDTSLDMLTVHEDDRVHALLINDGESREADAADIDNDGDLDIIIGNVNFLSNRPIENRLLINDGSGFYTDVTTINLASIANSSNSFTIRFFDIDSDGDPDILSADNTLNFGGDIDIWINDGSGLFSAVTSSPFSIAPSGSLFDIEVVDLNADGKDDLYFCYRTGADELYIQQ